MGGNNALGVLNSIARRLQPLRPLFWLLLAAGIVGFGMVVLGVFELSDGYGISCLVLCLWCSSLLVVVTYFPRQPVAILKADGLFVRLRKRASHGVTWLVAVVTILVNIGVIFTTLRLLAVIVNRFAN